MKYCKECGAKNKNSAEECTECGCLDFRFRCANCGTRFEKLPRCPQCGVKAGRSARTCPECGERYFSKACPECGYTPEGSAKASAIASPQRREPERHSKGSCIVGITCALFIVVAVVFGIRSLGGEAEELQRLSDETGLSAESIQRIEHLATSTGADFDALIDSAKHMAGQVTENPQLFSEAGVSLTTSDGSRRSFDDIFWDTLYALADDKESVAEARNYEVLSAETLQNASELAK